MQKPCSPFNCKIMHFLLGLHCKNNLTKKWVNYNKNNGWQVWRSSLVDAGQGALVFG